MISPNFIGYSPKELKTLPTLYVKSVFNYFISYDIFLLVFIEGSVFLNSAGYSYYTLELNIIFSAHLPSTSSFIAECHALKLLFSVTTLTS